jgi:hypothetical protein
MFIIWEELMKLEPLSRVCVSAAEDKPHSIPSELVVSSRRQRDYSVKSPAIHSAWQTQARVAKETSTSGE